MIEDWRIINYCDQFREEIEIGKDDVILRIDEVIQEAGYQYTEDNFGNEFSGMCQALGGGQYLIVFNIDQYWSEKFRRFTLAHELGHLSIPEHRRILEKDKLHRSKPEYSSDNEIEREADKFSINFLAPKTRFIREIKTRGFNKKNIEELSEIFGISTYATTLRFIDLTDLSCSLIINDTDGTIKYERRSKKFQDGFTHPFLYRQNIPYETQTYDYIKGFSIENESITDLSAWYQELNCNIDTNESIIELGYNNLLLTLIEPHESSLE